MKREPQPETEEEPSRPPAAMEVGGAGTRAFAQNLLHLARRAGEDRRSRPRSAEPKPPEAAQAEPPKPDAWSDAQVIAALRECVRVLGPIAADVEVSEPVKHEQCGAPAPVR